MHEPLALGVSSATNITGAVQHVLHRDYETRGTSCSSPPARTVMPPIRAPKFSVWLMPSTMIQCSLAAGRSSAAGIH